MDWSKGTQTPEPFVSELLFDSDNLRYYWEYDEHFKEMGKHELKFKNNNIFLKFKSCHRSSIFKLLLIPKIV